MPRRERGRVEALGDELHAPRVPERDEARSVDADQTVIIAGDRIVGVGPAKSTRIPRGATRIEGKGKWIVPGLVDAHVHFFQSGDLYTRPDGADFGAYMPYAKED